MPSPTGMLHSTPSRDALRYLPTVAETPDIAKLGDVSTIKATSGSGSHETAVFVYRVTAP